MTKKVYKNMVPGGVYKPVGGDGTTHRRYVGAASRPLRFDYNPCG